MMWRLGRLAFVLVVLSAGCVATTRDLPVIGSPRLTDEQQILLVLDDVHKGMETKRIYKVLAHVSRNYYDDKGGTYQTVEAQLKDTFARYRNIRLTRTQPRIQIQGDHARAVQSLGTRGDAINPQDVDLLLEGTLTVQFERVSGVWKIREWDPLQ
jgi:hypothetical protein